MGFDKLRFYPELRILEQIKVAVSIGEFMAERFLLGESVKDLKAVLTDEQAHHLARVMRAKSGDQVVLFDGCGTEHEATIDEVGKKKVVLSINSTRKSPDPNQPRIVVAAALPKGDRQKFLVEKLVELGANEFVPLKTQRSVADASEKAIDRIRKQVVEASKQCRRNWLMKVHGQTNVGAFLKLYAEFAGRRLIADPYTQRRDSSIGETGCVIAVGPEGGFSESELSEFSQHRWEPICISPNVLRVETAAAAAVAILRARSLKD